MSRAHTWLDRHEVDIPTPLRKPIRTALEGTGGVTSEALVDASLLCLRDAVGLGSERAAAVHLLAADALLTAAFGAAAEEGPGHVRSLAERAVVDLAGLLPDPSP